MTMVLLPSDDIETVLDAGGEALPHFERQVRQVILLLVEKIEDRAGTLRPNE